MILVTSFVFSQTASANWREEIGVFRIGIITGDDITGTLARIEPFRLAVSEALEMDVEFFPASNSRSLIDALVAERIEYAILSASGYALASVRCECVEPLVLPRSTDSTDGYHLVAILRGGSEFDREVLLKKRLAMLSPNAIAGEAFVEYLLAKEFPLEKSDDLLFEARETSEATQMAFANGEYDVLFGWSSLTGDPADGYSRGTLRQILQIASSDNSFSIGWRSPQIPHRPHILRKKLPGEAKTLLRDSLVNLFDRDPVAYDSIEPIYGGGFTAARNERFRELIGFFEMLNADNDSSQEIETDSAPSADQ
ncbi:MAG: PhnD/SsuA/transferrin family substrate-binding protein [Pseudomonadota bacterium]